MAMAAAQLVATPSLLAHQHQRHRHRCSSNFRAGGISRRSEEWRWSRASGFLLTFDGGRGGGGWRRNGGRNLRLRVAAEKPDLTNVAGNLLRIGRQGLEAGTKLVPESVPRPVAQAGIGLAGIVVGSFVLRSLFSTFAFILGIGALSYAVYYVFSKGDSTTLSDKGLGKDKPESTDDALEQARKIMDKYK